MENGDKPAFAKTRVMFKMRNWIAQSQKVNATCWTCHRGSTKPPGAAPEVKDLWPADLKLMAIFFRQTNPLALINGKTLGVGDLIDGIRVTKIERERVSVEWNGQVKELVTN